MGTFTLTVDVLEHFVVGTDFLFVFLNNAIHAVNCGIAGELFEFSMDAEVQNIRVKYAVVSHYESAFIVLIGLPFADTVRKLPRVSLLAIRLSHRFLLGFLNGFMETDIDKAFLFKKCFVDVRAHFFGARFDTEACLGLNQNAARWKLTPLH